MLWLLGGHDPTHGAGLYRDLVTARGLAPALPRRFAVTALTEQGGGRPARAFAVPAERLRARVARWPRPLAIKLGLVPDELAAVVAELVTNTGAPVVLDPVLRASDGGSLGATARGLAPLLAVATLVTPNRDEALALLATTAASVPAEPSERGAPAAVGSHELASALARRFPTTAVLLKDGHGTDPTRVVDRLILGPRVTPYARPRIAGPDPRGTGCALATAIATHLARGAPLGLAVADAIAWLDEARTRWQPGPDGRAHLPDHARPRS
jgi:hydroxymethylpyrimidine/phosphomethylpyrimidine kinase